eukprot:jgi/Chlat1/4343/Chrsp29S04492
MVAGAVASTSGVTAAWRTALVDTACLPRQAQQQQLQSARRGKVRQAVARAVPVYAVATRIDSNRSSSLGSSSGLDFGWTADEGGSALVQAGGQDGLAPGGQRVMELVGAWDELMSRLSPEHHYGPAAQTLLEALKLAVAALQGTPPLEGGRPRIARALAIAGILADMQMDMVVIATGVLLEAAKTGLVTLPLVEQRVGVDIAALLHDSLRVKDVPRRADSYDDDAAQALRDYCLAFHDIRAVWVELAARVDTMRHVHLLPLYRQQIAALETIQVYAPLAHALGTLEFIPDLEDAALKVLFPESYASLKEWYDADASHHRLLLEDTRQQLETLIAQDPVLGELVESFSVRARCKSLLSTMKKLLRGKQPDEVYDRLGIRVTLKPCASTNTDHEAAGIEACYRVQDIAHATWPPEPARSKDYIARPKRNGYQSLHSTITVDETLMELQVRTEAMDSLAEGGAAAHSAYKAMLDPEQAQRLRVLSEFAAEVAASRSRSLAQTDSARGLEEHLADQMFRLFDKNGDGVISLGEFREVMAELSSGGSSDDQSADAAQLMQLVDANSDGTVNWEEFYNFRRQVGVLRKLPDVDRTYRQRLGRRMQGLDQTVHAESAAQVTSVAEVASDDFAQLEEIWQSPDVAERPIEVDLAASPVYIGVDEEEDSRIEDDDATNQGTSTSAPDATELRQKARILYLAGQVDRARDTLDHCVQLFPLDGQALTQWATLERRSNDFVKARALFNKATRAFRASNDLGGCSAATKSWAIMESHLGNHSTAARLMEEALNAAIAFRGVAGVRSNPHEVVTVLSAWAATARRCKSPNVSPRELLQRASALEPSNVVVLHAWADLEASEGDLDRARELFRRCARVAPTDARVWQSWGRMEARCGDIARARQLFQQGLDAKPNNCYILHAWAVAEAAVGNAEAARELFKRSVTIDPANAPSWQAWGRLEADTGNYVQARELFSQGLAADPESVHCLQAAAHLERKAGDLSAARRLLQKAVHLQPENAAILTEWGVLENSHGDKPTAEALFARARRIDSTLPPKPGKKHGGKRRRRRRPAAAKQDKVV